MTSHTSPPPVCPECQSGLQRVRRGLGDRFVSLFVPVLRYRCGNVACGCEMLLRRPKREVPERREVPEDPYRGRRVLEASRSGAADDALSHNG